MTALAAQPIRLRELELANRIWISPMCQYSALDGVVQDWHLAHYGALATGGAGLVIAEATAVSPEGRISPLDAGLWNDEQVEAWSRITRFAREQGTPMGVQLGHAGRKASTRAPWEGRGSIPREEGGWDTISASPFAYDDWDAPREASVEELDQLVRDFGHAAERAVAAGFELVEIHAAHGYLLHQFLSPLTNEREDMYSGSLGNRMHLLDRIVGSVRRSVPASMPVLVRISAVDWAEGGLEEQDAVEIGWRMKSLGVDLVDVSTGGLVPQQRIPVGPMYQASFARAVRKGAGIPTSAVGMIETAEQIEQLLETDSCDAVMIGRAALRNPRFPLAALMELGESPEWRPQLSRAVPRRR